jgi:hypothetical protein
MPYPWHSYAGKDGLTCAGNLRGHAEGHFIAEGNIRRKVRSVFAPNEWTVGVNFADGSRGYYRPDQRIHIIRNRIDE